MKALSPEHISRITRRAHALADVTRIRIVQALARTELPVGRIATALASEPSTISKHLQVLFREGLVTRRRAASTVIYAIADDGVLDWCRYFAQASVGSGRQITSALERSRSDRLSRA
jgi:DNA-binding transcriptional ArsR family regulator